ncbi:unnamed protein product [Rotaria magnacalcarata]|uniref:Long-chain-fatty-acid--CoA ligase n=8 Tax=Rotaria magnacalcarata TaxID=392030 RepID=A0A816KYU3_9BILA|nr:unnamed protein product [Rotaria magnacalcarata]CAF1654446.1 unnamed protein product [Rotaria magnacalcarata]CAF1923272.1 unnamed protein product [Rotaria magnacalcarata]CAF1928405.1 unnamed protein product [Rotaria magnacalcarata]CAF2053005.1 unnamed protein product [Rotaria magnacalcarata]
MDRLVSDENLSSSMQTTLAVGGALALVAAAVIHRHKDKLSSLLVEDFATEEMNQDTDWQRLTISAQAQGCAEARIPASIGSRPLSTIGKSIIDDRTFATFYEGFQIGKAIATRRGDERCLGYRVDRQSPYQWVSYEEADQAATEVGSALIQLGENHGQNTFIGIYTINSVEWMTTALACHFHSMIYVPLYDTLGEPAVVHIINQTSLKTVFIDKPENVLCLIKLARQVPTLKRIILTKQLPSDKNTEIINKAKEVEIEIMTYTQLRDLGRSKPIAHHPPTPDDMFEICYTSGTTGLPKGAMLTHKNVVCLTQAATEVFSPVFTELETIISYLPLAHSYEQTIELYCLCNGFKIGYFSGDVRQLADDLAALKPTLMPCVPRLLNRMYDNIQATIRSLNSFKRFLFNQALSAKSNDVERHRVKRHMIWDRFVLKRIQQRLGGRVKLIVSGAAPLSPPILEFLKRVCGAYVVEGYGQTECCGISTCQMLGDPTTGNIGVPLNCNMIKLADVPDMQYFAKNNVGELCIKGANVFKGYFKDEEKTREALDSEGWLHTGDVAKWVPTGQIQIIDRKKHMFKLAQGEYVAPERIENIYIHSKYIAQVFVYGNGYKSFTVAIIVPDAEVLEKYALEKNITGNMVELCKKKEIKDLILNDMKQLEKANSLKGFEMSKDIYLHPELFSIENNLLTPTMKTKRPELGKYFETQIEEMYKNIE